MRIFATGSEARRLGPVLAAALVGALLAGGCLFTPRPAPPPCDPRTDPDCRVIVPPKTPLSPEAVRDNIKSGLQQKVVDPHYKDSLSEDFSYVPDLEAAARKPPGYFDAWDKATEVHFMQKVLESGTRPDSVTFFVPPGVAGFKNTDRLTDDQREYLVEYKWTLVFRDTTQTSGKRRDVYHFTAHWSFKGLNALNVKLFKWEEFQPPAQPDARSKGSSGFLRGDSGVR